MSETFEFFLLCMFRPLILFLGLFGNVISLLVLLRRKLVKIGPRSMYRYLFIIDLITLFKLMHPYVLSQFVISSSYVCKMSVYVIISIVTMSPWLIVYISVEKFISIKYPAWKSVLRRTSSQFIYLVLVLVFNFTYHMPTAFFFDIMNAEDTPENIFNSTRNGSNLACIAVDAKSDSLISYMDLASRVIIPSTLMIACTLLLILTVFRSRQRVVQNYTTKENRTFKRDLKLAISSIMINIIYVILSLPVSILFFFNDNLSDYMFNLLTSLVTYLFFTSYAINFYLLFFTNSLFRNECKLLFFKKKHSFLIVLIISVFVTAINCYKVDITLK